MRPLGGLWEGRSDGLELQWGCVVVVWCCGFLMLCCSVCRVCVFWGGKRRLERRRGCGKL